MIDVIDEWGKQVFDIKQEIEISVFDTDGNAMFLKIAYGSYCICRLSQEQEETIEQRCV